MWKKVTGKPIIMVELIIKNWFNVDVCPNYGIHFTFIAEIIDKVEMASAKMSPCFTTIMAQLMNDKNKIGIPICFQTDVILGRFHYKQELLL